VACAALLLTESDAIFRFYTKVICTCLRAVAVARRPHHRTGDLVTVQCGAVLTREQRQKEPSVLAVLDPTTVPMVVYIVTSLVNSVQSGMVVAAQEFRLQARPLRRAVGRSLSIKLSVELSVSQRVVS
jgi:hypothetical protein